VTIDTSEVRVTAASGASKGQKDARFDLIPPRVLKQVAVHYGLGARKYNPIERKDGEPGPAIDNWRLGYNYSSSIAALERHFNAWKCGEDIDEETGSNHLVAVIWHCMTLLEFQMTPGFPQAYDDRQQSIIGHAHASAETVREMIEAYGGTLPTSPVPTKLEPLPTSAV